MSTRPIQLIRTEPIGLRSTTISDPTLKWYTWYSMSKNNIYVPNRRTLSSLSYEERVYEHGSTSVSKYISRPRTCPLLTFNVKMAKAQDPDSDPGPVNGSGLLQPSTSERNLLLRPVNSIQGARGIAARILKWSPASTVSPIMTKFSQYIPHSTCYLVLVFICRQD
jgi:hypothetical protein